MKTRFLFVTFLLLALTIVACGTPATDEFRGFVDGPAAAQPPALPEAEAALPAKQESAVGSDANAAPGEITYNTGATVPDVPAYQRMVIKNAEITLLVKD